MVSNKVFPYLDYSIFWILATKSESETAKAVDKRQINPMRAIVFIPVYLLKDKII